MQKFKNLKVSLGIVNMVGYREFWSKIIYKKSMISAKMLNYLEDYSILYLVAISNSLLVNKQNTLTFSKFNFFLTNKFKRDCFIFWYSSIYFKKKKTFGIFDFDSLFVLKAEAGFNLQFSIFFELTIYKIIFLKKL